MLSSDIIPPWQKYNQKSGILIFPTYRNGFRRHVSETVVKYKQSKGGILNMKVIPITLYVQDEELEERIVELQSYFSFQHFSFDHLYHFGCEIP